MRWRWVLLLWACAALSGGSAARAASDSVLPVTITAFVGMPADSTSRREFLDGFDSAFEAGELPYEIHVGDQWTPTGERRTPFRLVDAAPSDQAWILSLSIGLPSEVRVPRRRRRESDPPLRARVSEVRVSRGLTIAVTAISPAAAAAAAATGTEALPRKFAVYFPDARRVVVPSARLPGGGYAYPWADAGRVVGRAALEALHRAKDMMGEDERADLTPAQRTEESP